MASDRQFKRAFSSGELTPELFGRVDLAKYESGLALCQNFIVLPHGPAQNRTGLEFVDEVSNSSNKHRVIPFIFSDTQSLVIGLGAGTIRFYLLGAVLQYVDGAAYNGATAYAVGDIVLSGGLNYYCIAATTGNAPPNVTYWYQLPTDYTYEIPSPYASADLFDIHYVQSNDIVTLTHPGYAQRELRRAAATNWQLVPITMNPTIGTPTGAVCVALPFSGAGNHQYKITAVSSAIGLEEGAPSVATANVVNNLSVAGNLNTISWTAVMGAQRYNVYSLSNGVYGYIGQTETTTFVDNNITPDTSRSPPLFDTTFASTNNYPAAVSYFEQRRIFAGTNSQPQNAWATKSGTEANMGYTIPTRDDNAIRFRIAAREASPIRHIIATNNLLFLTGSTEYRASSLDNGPLTASSLSIRPQSFIGASNVQPTIVNTSILFVQARGGRVREMAYTSNQYGQSAYQANDISILAPHLFDYYDITELAFARSPNQIVWAVSTNGKLLGMTYVPEQQVAAWHQHITDGEFESVCSIPEQGEDYTYVIVKRTINGATKRYVERMHSRNFATQSDWFFVDSGLTYDGASTSTISGLDHLEGKEVAILADGATQPNKTVSGGSITLQAAASKVQVGLPITARLQTLPLTVGGLPDVGHGHFKNVNTAWLQVVASSGLFVGPSFDKLVEFKQRTTEVYGVAPGPVTGEFKVVVKPAWNAAGQVCVEQREPLPVTISGLTLETQVGN